MVRTISISAIFLLALGPLVLPEHGLADGDGPTMKICRSTPAGVTCTDADPGDPALADRWPAYVERLKKKQVGIAYLYSFSEDLGGGFCPILDWRNEILYVDCGAALDGPAYFIDEVSGEFISSCGGACWRPVTDEQIRACETLCPPPKFLEGQMP